MKKLLVGMLAAAGMSATFATEIPFTAEVLVGKTTQSVTGEDDKIEADATSVAVRLGYEFADSWAAEVAYYDYGKATSNSIDDFGDNITDTISSSAFLLGIKKEFNLNEHLSFNARAGLAFWDFDYTSLDSSDPSNPTKSSDNGNDLYYGVGLAYSLKENLLVSLDYSAVSIGAGIKSDGTTYKVDNDISTISVGVGYQF